MRRILMIVCQVMVLGLAGSPHASTGSSAATSAFFSSHGTKEADIWWLVGLSTMHYVVKGSATPQVAADGRCSLSIEDFTVKLTIVPHNPAYEGWVFVDRSVEDRVFWGVFDAEAGTCQVRADAEFWFPTRSDNFWIAGWTGIVLTSAPDGSVIVTPETDTYEDWWFL